MAGALFLPPYPEFADDGGAPLSGGSVEFFLSGTSTPATVYSDQALTVSLGSVVALNAAGRPQSGGGSPVSIWISSVIAYKVVVKRADTTTVRTVDPYRQSDPNPATLAVYSYLNSGAITIADALHKLEKAGSPNVMTLANPSAEEEGIVMHIQAQTAFAHTVTVTGGFAGAGAGADVATFGGAVGDGMTVIAVNALWHVVALRNVTLA